MKLIVSLVLDKGEQIRCRRCNWMISENEEAVLVAEPESEEIFVIAVFCKLCVHEVDSLRSEE